MIACTPCAIKSVCFNLIIEGDFLMKKLILLALTFSSFLAVACGDNSIQNVGGPVSDGQSSIQTNSGLSASFSGDVGTDCVELPPIKVTGFVYFSIQRLVIGITYALNASGGGGGGGGADETIEVDQNLNCSSSHSGKRFDAATLAFKAAMLKAMKPGGIGRFAFCRQYPAESIFEFELPNGQTADYRVFSCTASFRPLSLEIPNSCG